MPTTDTMLDEERHGDRHGDRDEGRDGEPADRRPAEQATARPAPAEPDAAERSVQEQRERYRELLEELRTILPGVQVLFAFLLTVPFSARFTELDDLGRGVYGAAMVGMALAIVALLAPSAFHRMGQRTDRAERLQIGIRAVIVGVVLLTASVPAVIFAVVRFVYDSTAWGLAVGGITLAASITLWYLVPLRAAS